jgi:exoribonuclease II
MQVVYEDSGDIKAASVMADHGASLQVETPHGKRTKIKSAQVLLRCQAPSPGQLLEQARQSAAEMDADFIWEAAGEAEFSFTDLARDYFGHEPSAMEATAVLLVLHGSPMHFYKKGRGRYKAAPPDALSAAKASVERKVREKTLRDGYVAELTARRLPEALRGKLTMLLYRPDKNAVEYKALEEACHVTGLSAVKLLAECDGGLDAGRYLLDGFFLEHFPKGKGFPQIAEPFDPPQLPESPASAFSIDDAATTEIDDAFSVQWLDGGRARLGIHIAAPALGVVPGSALDGIARGRLSTVYMPGDKITMLPEVFIHHYTLGEGGHRPVLSLYLDVDEESLEFLAQETLLEKVHVAANLRHETLEAQFNEQTIGGDGPDYPFRTELEWLWHLAGTLERTRGQDETVQRVEYAFKVENDRVEIIERRRGSPIDKVVAELMILANSRWGKWLADNGAAAIYRVQGGGKVRMTTSPAGHEGLGVECYAWSSSPLRRYVDLVNQRQLIALAQGRTPPYAANDSGLFAVLRDFELAYEAYNSFQRRMERYWCLRWLIQEDVREREGVVLKENLIRLDGMPLVVKVHNLPTLAPGSRVRLALDVPDLFDLAVDCRYLAQLEAA